MLWLYKIWKVALCLSIHWLIGRCHASIFNQWCSRTVRHLLLEPYGRFIRSLTTKNSRNGSLRATKSIGISFSLPCVSPTWTMSRPTPVDSERILWKAVVSWRMVCFFNIYNPLKPAVFVPNKKHSTPRKTNMTMLHDIIDRVMKGLYPIWTRAINGPRARNGPSVHGSVDQNLNIDRFLVGGQHSCFGVRSG